MHAHVPPIDIELEASNPPLAFSPKVVSFFIAAVVVGAITLLVGFLSAPAARVWASYYVSLIFFMGLAAGGVIISAIFQIVRATWSGALRRIAEANVAFLPIALVGVCLTWFGRKELFPWALSPRPGSEWWMQPVFVYVRNASLLAILFYLMWRFVAMSLRGDAGLKGELNGTPVPGWKGSKIEIPVLQRTMSRFAPTLIMVYGVVYSFFVFEMVMAMDKAWLSNLLGAYYFVGNVYIGWACLSILTVYFAATDEKFGRLINSQIRWDIGKLTFGFCMLWGYFSLSQFLPQWYGNLPEETQWLILRTREYPWKYFLYFTFGTAFVFPFITLLSREVKKRAPFLVAVCSVILLGVWNEKFFVIMPHVSSGVVPIGLLDIGIFLGFFGLYGLSLRFFLARTPRIALGHPLTRGDTKW